MRRLVLLFAAALLLLAACTSDDSATDTTAADGDTTTSAAGDTVDTADLPSFETVAQIGEALNCNLEYDGIVDAEREYSTCVFNEEQALIYIYTDPAVVADVVAAGSPALAYGANWTIELETAAVAQTAADATDGAVAAPAG